MFSHHRKLHKFLAHFLELVSFVELGFCELLGLESESSAESGCYYSSIWNIFFVFFCSTSNSQQKKKKKLQFIDSQLQFDEALIFSLIVVIIK